MFKRIILAALALCVTRGALAAPVRTTTVTLVQSGRTSLVEVPADTLLQVKADESQSGPTPQTTTLKGHVILTVQRRQGPLTLNADQATVESNLIEVQVTNVYSPPINPGEDMRSLSESLRKFPSASAFRITWDFFALGASVWETELYLRQEQTFSSYSVASDEQGIRTTREVYSKVQDSTIHQLAKRDGQELLGLDDFGALYDRQKSYRLRLQTKK